MAKKVVVHWDAAGLRAVPDEINVNSRAEQVSWELESDRRSGRISNIVFEGAAHGPFLSVGRSSDVAWSSQGSKDGEKGRRYKYSVYVTDGNEVLELDPYIIDTDKP